METGGKIGLSVSALLLSRVALAVSLSQREENATALILILILIREERIVRMHSFFTKRQIKMLSKEAKLDFSLLFY